MLSIILKMLFRIHTDNKNRTMAALTVKRFWIPKRIFRHRSVAAANATASRGRCVSGRG
jgi:hypothetical protein